MDYGAVLNSGFKGFAFVAVGVALWLVLKGFAWLWRWLTRDAVRSLGRASGAAVSTGRKLSEEFKSGYSDRS